MTLAYAGIVVAARTEWVPAPQGVLVTSIVALSAALLTGAFWVLRPIRTLAVLQQVDRRLGLKSRLSTAFAIQQKGQAGAFAAGVYAQAEEAFCALRLSEALPLRFSKWTPAVAALALLVSLWPDGGRDASPAPDPAGNSAATAPVPLLSSDEGEAFRFATTEEDPRIAEYNALVDALANGEISNEAAFAKLLSLRANLGEGVPGSADADHIAARLRAAAHFERLAKALSEGRPNDVNEASSHLMNVLGQLSRKDRAEMARALQAARREAQSLSQQAEAEARRLLKRRSDEEAREVPERSRLLKRRHERTRRLDQLRREAEAQSERARRLERLRRDIADAERALGQRQASGAANSEAMRRLAEALRRLAEQGAQQNRESALQRRLETLQRMLQERRESGGQTPQGGEAGPGGQAAAPRRQQGPGSEPGEQRARLQRFTLQAAGRTPSPQGQGTEGEGARGEGGPSRSGGSPANGQGGEPGGEQGRAEGRGQQGTGNSGGHGGSDGASPSGGTGRSDGQGLLLGGPGGDGLLMLPGQTQGGMGSGTDGSGEGEGHDPARLDAPTALDAAHRDVSVRGQRTAGRSRSEVIFDAASRGFATEAYGPVFEAYEGHAEEVIERDQVPPGYQFYVRRYFQLIRPREGTTQ